MLQIIVPDMPKALSFILMAIFALVVLTNLVVEVLKKAVFARVPATLLAFVVALVLALLTFFIYAAYAGLVICWYYIPAVCVLGIVVAYGAMFGFDKLKEAMMRISNYDTGGK